jgi:hypothetical protein
VADNVIPFYANESERARRVFLTRVEEALAAQGADDLACAYPLLRPPFEGALASTVLEVQRPDAPGVARIVAVTLRRHFVSTRPDAGPSLVPVLEALRDQLRGLGIAGVTGMDRSYEPFPAEGSPTYELTLLEPAGDEMATVDFLCAADPAEIARRIVEWRDAPRLRQPPAPRDAASLKRLRAAAEARRQLLATLDRPHIAALRQAGRLVETWQAAGLATALDPARPRGDDGAPTATDRPRCDEDLAALLPENLLWHFPRDERGRLALGERVLLAAYDGDAPLGQGRRLWLAAEAPARRRDPQVVTLRLVSAIGENHTHQWSEARWLWDARAQQASQADRWGVADLPLARLGWDAWRTALDEAPAASAPPTPAERATRCLWLQDAGRLREALALYDVELTPAVEQILDGEPLGYHYRDYAAPWARATQEALRASALWRFPPLVQQATAAREAWVAEKRSRRWSPPLLRLFWLPHQTQQSKESVVLVPRGRTDPRPRLDVESSAHNARLPAVAWRRPLEIDLLRFGLLTPADVP